MTLRRGESWFGERGAALVCALMVIALLSTLGAALVVVVTTECLIGANHRAAQLGLYGADAGVERAIGELRRLASWQAVPSAASTSPDFNDGAMAPRMPDDTVLDLAGLTAERQAESDVFYPGGPDRPVWRLFAHASLDRMVAGGIGAASPYVVVWVADDPDDLDGDPDRDANNIVLVRSEAFGVRGARRTVEATIALHTALDATMPGATRSDVSLIAWRQVR